MPSVSQAQNRAMHAAAEGNSTLGIPKSVGQEFVSADQGSKVGALPEKADPKSKHPKRRGKRGRGRAKHVNHTPALQRLQQAHEAVSRGDITQGMHHIGHALNHLRQAARTTAPAQPQPQPPDPDGYDDMPGNDHFIQGAIKHPGALHRDLGVPQGQTIPAKKIAKAAHSENPTIARRARLAETLKKMHHK